MQAIDVEGRISTIDFRIPSLSTFGDGSEESGSPVPGARDEVRGSVLRRAILTSCLEGRGKRCSSKEPYCLLVNGSSSIIHLSRYCKSHRVKKNRLLILRCSFYSAGPGTTCTKK